MRTYPVTLPLAAQQYIVDNRLGYDPDTGPELRILEVAPPERSVVEPALILWRSTALETQKMLEETVENAVSDIELEPEEEPDGIRRSRTWSTEDIT